MDYNTLSAEDELIESDIEEELYRINKYLKATGSFVNKTQEAKYKMYSYIATCVRCDPIDGDYYNEENNKLMIEAGQILNELVGFEGMKSAIFKFKIPKRYHNDINYMWNGIGEWRC